MVKISPANVGQGRDGGGRWWAGETYTGCYYYYFIFAEGKARLYLRKNQFFYI